MAFKKYTSINQIWACGLNTEGRVGDNTTTARSSPVQIADINTEWSSLGRGSNSKHFSAIKTDGTLWTWGPNSYGELGDESTSAKSSPVNEISNDKWRKVRNTNYSTAAIKTDGTLWTWGRNSYGQLGDNSVTSKSSPVQTVAGGTDWKDIGAGADFICAIKENNTIWCFGRNDWGNLGDESITNKSSPVQVVGSSTDWKQVSCGYTHTAAIKTNGELWSWGAGSSGKLGNLSIINRSSPVQEAVGGTNWKQVCCTAYGTFSIKADNTLWSWGQNSYGELCHDDRVSRSSPVQCMIDVFDIGAGSQHVAIIKKSNNTLWVCGRDSYAPLGINTVGVHKSSPVQTVAGGTDWYKVSGSDYNTFAIKKINEQKTEKGPYVSKGDIIDIYENLVPTLKKPLLWVWGDNYNGELGTEEADSAIKSSPVQTVAGGLNWKQISKGYLTDGALKTDGTLWAWGRNDYGALGDDSTIYRSSPVQEVTNSTDWKLFRCGYSHSHGIKTDGTLWTWGRNSHGQLGTNNATHRSSPVQTVAGGTDWKDVGSGFWNNMALKMDGTLWAWGYNAYGTLGDDSTINRSSPVQIMSGTTFSSIANQTGGRSTFSAMISDDGKLWAVGRNNYGQLGDDSVINKSSPVQTVAGGTDWKYASCGYRVLAAIKTDGTLWLTGINLWGALGDGTAINRSSPVQIVTGGTDWKKVVAGFRESTAAIKNDGTLWIWGDNTKGQLGTEESVSVKHSSPVQTIMGGTDWKDVAGDGYSWMGLQEGDDW